MQINTFLNERKIICFSFFKFSCAQRKKNRMEMSFSHCSKKKIKRTHLDKRRKRYASKWQNAISYNIIYTITT